MMDALVAYGSGSEESDNAEQQQKHKQSSSREEGDISTEIPVSETSTITLMDLPLSSRVPLPLELNCEVFKCLKLPVQRKFIWGLGRDIYGIFGQKLLKKTKRVRNPQGNSWNRINTRATVAADGLKVSYKVGCPNVFAVHPFPISGPQYRVDEFPGTICYYYEIKGQGLSMVCTLGLSGSPIPHNSWIGQCPNSYAILTAISCWLAGERHELPQGQKAIRLRWVSGSINVLGCGLLLDPEDKLSIFFTLNGNLLGRKIPIKPTVDSLFPAVAIGYGSSIEVNFGGDPAKPFEYDVKNCPGLGLACI